jgi:hypothetical protein
MSDTPGRLPLGFKVIIGFHVFSLVTWFLGQTMAVVAYDRVAEWGLQEPRALLEPAVVEVNRAIGLADTIVQLPLFVVGAVGLAYGRFYGAVASWLVFGMTVYWPVVFWCSQAFYRTAGVRHAPTSTSAIVLPACLFLIACWGSWYMTRRREWLH